MFSLAFDFLIGALVAATFGFGAIPTRWAGLARVLFFVLLLCSGVRLAMERLEQSHQGWGRRHLDQFSEGIGR